MCKFLLPMMRKPMLLGTLRGLLLFLLLSGQIATARADEWEPPRERSYESENGKYIFRITPHSSLLPVGRCRGALYLKDGKELKRQWERPLINNHAPYFAVVSDSGRYVVTLSEWADLNSLPIVLYGPLGDLINVYGKLDQIVSIRSFGMEIPASMSGYFWLSHAVCFFGPNDEHFIIRMCTQQVLVFETETGELIDNKWKEKRRSFRGHISKYENLEGKLKKLILLRALRLAASDESWNKEDGKFVLGQYRDNESISMIQQALKDETSRIVELPQGKVREYPIRKAAKEALEAAGEKVPENVIVEERVK